MSIEITVKNYRCFDDRSITHFTLGPGTTAFIGINNTGKSTLLRFFYELRPLFQLMAGSHETWKHLCNGGIDLPHPKGTDEVSELFHKRNKRDLVLAFRKPTHHFPSSSQNGHHRLAKTPLEDNPSHMFHLILTRNQRVYIPDGSAKQLAKLWIPHFSQCANTLYVGPCQGFQQKGKEPASADISFGKSFCQKFIVLRSSDEIEKRRRYQRVLSDLKEIFNLKSIAIFPKSGSDELMVRINRAAYDVNELGTGFSRVLHILGQGALTHSDYILIDEPECHLHASLQEQFVTCLSGYAKRGLLFASHNMGLAKSAAESLYLVRRPHGEDSSTIREFSPEQRLSESLGELNFSAQQTLGFRKVLLVEGPTEVKAMRQLLRKVNAHRDFVLLPLGGSSMITSRRDDELKEIKRICPHVYAMIDSEKTHEEEALAPSRIGFLRSCMKAGIHCHILKRRMFESYFSDRAIKKILGKPFHEIGDYEDLRQFSVNWPKADNWKIVREMRWDEFQGSDLASFTEQIATEN